MSRPDTYTQVCLRGRDEAEGQERVDWVPTRYAGVGKTLVIDDLPGRWLVAHRYETAPAARVVAQEGERRGRWRDVLGD